jgi:O-antigen/teichoic acid export membrane protein
MGSRISSPVADRNQLTPGNSGANFSLLIRNVTRQGAVVLLTRGAAVLLGFAVTICVARVLGPAGFGKFKLGSVVVVLITTFCVLGLDRALLRYIPMLETRGGAGIRRLLLRSGGLVFALSLLFGGLLIIAAPLIADHYFHSAEMTGVLRMFSIQIPVLALVRFLVGAATAAKRVDFSSKITNVFSPAMFLLLVPVVALVYPGLYGIITARSIAQFAAAVWLIGFLARRYRHIEQQPATDIGTFKSYLQLSIPLFFIVAGYQLLGQTDTMVLGYFVSEKEVGIYSVAAKVSAFVLIGPEILLPIVAPLFSELNETGDRSSLEALFTAVTKWFCYSASMIFAAIAILRAEVLHVFGNAFTTGTTALLILAVGQLANAVTGPTGVLLTMTGKQKWEVGNISALVLLNLVLNVWLVPRMGSSGAALATAISITVINAAKLIQVYQIYGFRAHNLKFAKGVIAIGAATLIGYFIRNLLSGAGFSPYIIMPAAVAGFTIMAGITFWLLGLENEDKMVLVALRRR